VFGATEVKYIGRIVGHGKIHIDPEGTSIQTLRDAADAQMNPDLLRRTLGGLQYFNSFVPHMSSLLAPLHAALNATDFKWTKDLQLHLHVIIEAVTAKMELAIPDPRKQQILRTDASRLGIAGILLQRDLDDKVEIVALCSRKLTNAEIKYPTIEQEGLAIVWSLRRLEEYVLGPLTVITDHSNLQYMMRSINPRVQHWCITLGAFDVRIIYAPGSTNALADWLSRAFNGIVEPFEPSRAVEINHINALDPDIATLREIIDNIPFEERNGVRYLHAAPPSNVIRLIWALAHENIEQGHFSAERTKQRIATALIWPGMNSDIERLNAVCSACQKVRSQRPHPEELASTAATKRFKSIMVDYIGPISFGEEDPVHPIPYHYILVILDRFSELVELIASNDTTAETTAQCFVDDWFNRYGIPELITTDGGSSFAGQVEKLIAFVQARHHISAPLHPEGHGSVERKNRDVEQTLRALLVHRSDWWTYLRAAQWALNSAYSRTLGCSPFFVVYGCNPRLCIHDALGIAAAEKGEGGEPLTIAEQRVAQALDFEHKVAEHHAKVYQENCRAARRDSRGQVDFNPSDFVLLWFPRAHKLDVEWHGPYVIVRRLDHLLYIVADLESGAESTVHVNRLHRFWPGTLTQDQLRAEAAKRGEYYVERVLRVVTDHTGEIWFRVYWLGYPHNSDSDDGAFVKYPDCRFDRTIRAFIEAHPEVATSIAVRNRKLGRPRNSSFVRA